MNDQKKNENAGHVDPHHNEKHDFHDKNEKHNDRLPKEDKKDKPDIKPPVTQQDKLEKIRDIIQGSDTPMVTSVHEGKPMSRPMKVQEAEFDGTLWFFTLKDTAKYNEIKAEPRVNVAFSGDGYLSLSGKGEFVEDPAFKKRLWNNWAGKFFDLEYDDPKLTLLKVTAESAEYWQSDGMIKNIVNMVKSLGGNEKAQEELNSSINFNNPKA